MRLTVIGTGYLGAVHAACLAEIGHEVLGLLDGRNVLPLSQWQAAGWTVRALGGAVR